MKKKLIVTVILACFIATFVACKSKPEKEETVPQSTEEVVPTDTPAPTQTPEPTMDPHAGEARSKLTGKWIPENIAKKRPYAMMINNIQYAAQFQSGASQASIIYEAKVEGGITRLMGIFEKFNAKKLGSTRSARHYYVSVASEYDAIFVHFGHTKFATSKIEKLKVDNISGLSGIGGLVFYRDNSIPAPHNAFTSKEGLEKGRKKLKYRKNYKDDYEGHYSFYDEDTDLAEGKIANKVTVKFSGYSAPYFIYNKDKKMYYRYQYNNKHIDASNGKQLAFKNLIIQYVDDEPIVPGHPKDYRTINFENATGKGKYISNGKAINITWEKNEKKGIMKYYNKDGSELFVNPGKTYIALFPDSDSKLTISKKVK
ncbi:MAG: DUF3048 domain-containing protein [Lachnospiraceae bacterium]|nr:DUF3048 domain-containing protein [Lachnospiraceae bacterium]